MSQRHPFEFADAREASDAASAAQQASEQAVTDAYKAFATAEKVYRIALARRLVELRTDGTSITLCGDLARGDEYIAGLKCERDAAEGTAEAMRSAAWRHTADRKELLAFIEWSMRAFFLDLEPPRSSAIGGRRAA